jgi:hypothetical protein
MNVPELIIERYAAGIASADERARVDASPEAKARVAELLRDNEAIFAALPTDGVVKRVQTRAKRRATDESLAKRFVTTWEVAVTSAIAAACCAAFVLFAPSAPPTDDGPEVTRAKGLAPQLALYRQRGTTVEKLANGDIARAGDTLQVAYIAGERTYGAIVSVDGRASATVHPLAEGGKLSQKGEVVLAKAYTLDDAPYFERFVFVAGAQPVDSAEVARLLHENASVDVVRLRDRFGSVDVVVFTVRKAPL